MHVFGLQNDGDNGQDDITIEALAIVYTLDHDHLKQHAGHLQQGNSS